MNVCYIAHDSNLTGANRSLLDILSCCKEKGINPLVIIPKNGKIENELKKINVKYKIVKYTGCIKSSKLKNLAKNIINYSAIKKIKCILEEHNIELVHNNSILVDVGMKAASNLKIPYVCHIREFGIEDHNLEFMNEENLYTYLEKASSVIAISKSVYNKFYKLIPKANMSLVYNGVNLKQHEQINKNIFVNREVKLLLAGRICDGKGQLEAVKAIEYLAKEENITNIKLYIVGNGIHGDDYLKNLKFYIEKNQLNNYIEIMSFTDNLRTIRNLCDIGLICSKNEAFGRVTIETMLSNELVIGANTAGTAELIQDNETGLLYEQGNYISLANKIKYAIQNKENVISIVNTAFDYANANFSIERTVDEIVDIYNKII